MRLVVQALQHFLDRGVVKIKADITWDGISYWTMQTSADALYKTLPHINQSTYINGQTNELPQEIMPLAIMFVEENEHGFIEHMHITVAALFRAFALIMQDKAGKIIILPSTLKQTVAQINVLSIHEKVLIEQANLVKRPFANHIECTRNHLNGIGFLRIKVSHIITAKNSAVGEKRTQTGHLAETGKGSGQSSAAFRSETSIGMKHAHTSGTHIGMRVKEIETHTQSVFRHNGIGIQQQDIFARAFPDGKIVGA